MARDWSGSRLWWRFQLFPAPSCLETALSLTAWCRAQRPWTTRQFWSCTAGGKLQAQYNKAKIKTKVTANASTIVITLLLHLPNHSLSSLLPGRWSLSIVQSQSSSRRRSPQSVLAWSSLAWYLCNSVSRNGTYLWDMFWLWR